MTEQGTMAEKHRLNGQPFTCANRGFHTDVREGVRHGDNEASGSVSERPLATTEDGKTLWLEHVLAKADGKQHFWFMWYDPKGNPTIPASGVFSRDDLRGMAQQFQRVP